MPVYRRNRAGQARRKLFWGTVSTARESALAAKCLYSRAPVWRCRPRSGWRIPMAQMRTSSRITMLNCWPSLTCRHRNPSGSKARKDADRGAVFGPPHFDAAKKYPMLLLIHGGRRASGTIPGDTGGTSKRWRRRDTWWWRSIPRGSFGYGQKFTEDISRDWGGKVYEDLMKGVDAGLRDIRSSTVRDSRRPGVRTAVIWSTGSPRIRAGSNLHQPRRTL